VAVVPAVHSLLSSDSVEARFERDQLEVVCG
jgi:hypothetical protein